LKFSAKKVVFLVSSGKSQISPLVAPIGKILEKTPGGSPQEKILPTPMATVNTHGNGLLSLLSTDYEHRYSVVRIL